MCNYEKVLRMHSGYASIYKQKDHFAYSTQKIQTNIIYSISCMRSTIFNYLQSIDEETMTRQRILSKQLNFQLASHRVIEQSFSKTNTTQLYLPDDFSRMNETRNPRFDR